MATAGAGPDAPKPPASTRPHPEGGSSLWPPSDHWALSLGEGAPWGTGFCPASAKASLLASAPSLAMWQSGAGDAPPSDFPGSTLGLGVEVLWEPASTSGTLGWVWRVDQANGEGTAW